MLFHYRRSLSLIPLALLLSALAGCDSHPQHGDEFARAVDQGEHLAMQGTATFFDGQILATIDIDHGVRRGGGAKGGGGGGGPRGGGGSVSSRSDDDLKDLDADQTAAYMRSKGALGSPMPPVTLHLKLQNLSPSTYSVDVEDFESDLGNFAVNPEVLALAPNQAAEPDPMISALGVTTDRLPVKVTLKLGAKTETQTVMVVNVVPPTAPPIGAK